MTKNHRPKRGGKLSKPQQQLHDAAPRLIDVDQVAQQHTKALENLTQALSASTSRHLRQYNERNAGKKRARRKSSPSSFVSASASSSSGGAGAGAEGQQEEERVLPKPYRDSQRRTTSHQRYVIPWARRNASKTSSGEADKDADVTRNLCRKARRKPSSLRQEWDNYAEVISQEAARDPAVAEKLVESEGPVRLPTHYSQCKRLHMSKQYGYYLPLRNNNFGLKGAITKSRAGTLVHDESYYHQIEIKGRLKRIIEVLIHVTDPNRFDSESFCSELLSKERNAASQYESESFLHQICSPMALNGRCSVSFTVYAPLKFPKQAISPVKLIWRPRKPSPNLNLDHKYTAMLWVHPSASAAVHRSLVNASRLLKKDSKMAFEATVHREKLARLRCVGVTALRTLEQALGISRAHFPSAEVQRDSCIVYTKIQDPRFRGLPSRSKSPTNEIEVLSNDPDNGSFVPVLSSGQLSDTSASAFPGLSSALPSTNAQRRSGQDTRLPLSCPRIEQEEWASARVIWDSRSRREECNQLLTDAQCCEIRQSENDDLVNSVCSSKDIGNYVSPIGSENQFISVAVQVMATQSTLKRQQEVEVVCNRDASRIIWNTLLRYSCQPIGIQQMDYYKAACQRLTFPQDYIDTESGKTWWQDRHAKEMLERQRRPKHHRTNLSSFQASSPDKSMYEALLALIRQRQGDGSDNNKQSSLSIARGQCYLDMLLPSWGEEDLQSNPLKKSPLTVLLQCRWKMWSRGNPQEGALICLPTDEDVRRWNTVMGLKKKDRESLLTKNLIDHDLLHWYGPQEHGAPSRETIGYVTSAARNPDSCCTQGNGVVIARSFEEAMSSNKTPTDAIINRYRLLKGRTPSNAEGYEPESPPPRSTRGGNRRLAYVLIRTPTSCQYYPAILVASAGA